MSRGRNQILNDLTAVSDAIKPAELDHVLPDSNGGLYLIFGIFAVSFAAAADLSIRYLTLPKWSALLFGFFALYCLSLSMRTAPRPHIMDRVTKFKSRGPYPKICFVTLLATVALLADPLIVEFAGTKQSVAANKILSLDKDSPAESEISTERVAVRDSSIDDYERFAAEAEELSGLVDEIEALGSTQGTEIVDYRSNLVRDLSSVDLGANAKLLENYKVSLLESLSLIDQKRDQELRALHDAHSKLQNCLESLEQVFQNPQEYELSQREELLVRCRRDSEELRAASDLTREAMNEQHESFDDLEQRSSQVLQVLGGRR